MLNNKVYDSSNELDFEHGIELEPNVLSFI